MNLVNKLRKGLKRTVLIGTAVSVLGFSSCPMPTPPKPNNPPTAILNVNPIEGYAPLETLIQTDGADLDGKEDIVEYKIGEDKNDDGDIDDYGELIKSSPNPINETVIFNTSGIKKIYGQVMDSQGAVGRAGPISIDVSLASGDPTVDLSGVNTDLLEEEVRDAINLPPPTDPNPEDMPVPYTTYIDRISTDGKVTSTLEGDVLNGYQLAIEGNEDEKGFYQIELEFGSVEGGIGNATLDGFITNLVDISGTLEDNETDLPQAGIIKVFKKNLDESYSQIHDPIDIDSSGNFDFQLDQVVSEVILQARLDMGSYVRTVRLDGAQDYLDVSPVYPIRAVPYDGEISIDFNGDGLIQQEIDDFRTHMEETNISTLVVGYPPKEIGLRKWNFGEFLDIVERFEKIVIVRNDPDTGSSFIQDEIDFIESKINALDDVKAYVEGRELPIQIVESKSEVSSYADKIIVLPVDDLDPEGLGLGPAGDAKVYDDDLNRYINAVRIRLRLVADTVVSHEFGHAFIALGGEATTLSGDYTIMAPSTLLKPGPADIKAASIVYEDTYLGGERLDDLLGMGFLDD